MDPMHQVKKVFLSEVNEFYRDEISLYEHLVRIHNEVWGAVLRS